MHLRPVLTRIAGPGALGAVIALGQAPFGLWPLSVLGMAVAVIWLGRCGGWRQAAGLGWMIGTGYFALALVWIVQPFFVDPWRHGWMAPFAILFMSAGLALFWGAGFAFARRLGGGALAVAGAFTLAELGRSYLFTGFPWALTGHVLVDTPLAQAASVAGAHGLGVLVLAGALGARAAWRRQWAGAGAAVLMLGAVWVWGVDRPAEQPDLAGRPVLRLVQPNAPQHQKWNPDLIPVFFRRQVDFTAEGQVRPDLVVWPETALPVLLDDAERGFQIITEAAKGVPVVLGIERLEDGALYNSAVLLRPDGTPGPVYDKHHLVPFGEYIPLGDWLHGLGLQGMAAKDGNGFAAGPGPALMDLGDRIGQALPLICYEAVFPGDVRGAPDRPALLLQLTNDAWFGTFSGPYQHLAQARLRAIETGLPLARSANTGVSAMIDPWGRITAQIALGQAGWVDAALPVALGPTPYSRTGDWPIALLAVLAALTAGLAPRAFGRSKPR